MEVFSYISPIAHKRSTTGIPTITTIAANQINEKIYPIIASTVPLLPLSYMSCSEVYDLEGRL